MEIMRELLGPAWAYYIGIVLAVGLIYLNKKI